MKKTGLLALALVVMLGIVARGEAAEGAKSFYTGNEILSKCKSPSTAWQDACKMFLATVLDTTRAWNRSSELQELVCPPNNVTTEDLKAVFIKHASDKKNKKQLDDAAASLAVDAFLNAYFCKISRQ